MDNKIEVVLKCKATPAEIEALKRELLLSSTSGEGVKINNTDISPVMTQLFESLVTVHGDLRHDIV